jgi:hypothetical protein
MRRSRILDDQVVESRPRPRLILVEDRSLPLPRARRRDSAWVGAFIVVCLGGLAVALGVMFSARGGR